MVKKSIGIDIGRHHIRAVQLARTGESLRVERTFGSQTRRSTDSPATVLISLFAEHGFDRHADVAVSLPSHGVFFADAETDDSTLSKLRTGDGTAVKDCLPVETEDAVVQVCSIRPAVAGHRVVLAAVSRRTIEEEMNLLKEAKIRPGIMDTAIGAAQLAVATNHPDILKGVALILSVDEFSLSLTVTEDGHILLVRTMPVRLRREQSNEASAQQLAGLLRSEIQITWRKLFGVGSDDGLRVFLVSAPRATASLAAAIEEQMNCRVTSVDPYAAIGRPSDETPDFDVSVAEGLALRAFASDSAGRPNFLSAHRARTRPDMSMKKEAILCMCLGAAVGIVWVVGLLLQMNRLETRYAGVKSEIDREFRAALPDEKNVVNPGTQLKQRLDSIRADYAAVDSPSRGYARPLEVLSAVTNHQPANGDIVLDDMLITGDSLRLTGSCKSFAALSQWQHTLETTPGFKAVEAPNTRKDTSTGRVRFSLSLSCGKAVQ
jgi:Tfp pilus assembly PilM family ATPase/Tfp pilus assembly protein PilN